MSNSELIGALPLLGRLWNLKPYEAAILVFFLDFGMICFWMVAEGRGPFKRHLYATFSIGDSIFIPLYIFAATQVMWDSSPSATWYTTPAWHWFVLFAGVASSILLEVLAVHGGQYTLSQELSPSKLWHTIIFAVVFYWLMTSIPFVFGPNPSLARYLVIFALAGWVGTMGADWSRSLQLHDAHLEGTYIPWEWHVRQK